jgi:hypothetical protein
MRTTQDFGENYGEMPRDTYGGDSPTGTGWVLFSAIMLGILGIWTIFEGIAAISNAHVYVSGAHYVFSDLNTWGWIVAVLGVLLVIASLSLLSGSEWARWFGVAVAGLNAVGQLAFIPAYPVWGLLLFTVDILIIYGLVVYGGARLRMT